MINDGRLFYIYKKINFSYVNQFDTISYCDVIIKFLSCLKYVRKFPFF